MVRLLLAHQDVELNQANANGATALMIASQNGHVAVLRLLLARQGVEVNKTAQDGFTVPVRTSRSVARELVYSSGASRVTCAWALLLGHCILLVGGSSSSSGGGGQRWSCHDGHGFNTLYVIP
jgi:ankyrin repeat protein